MKLIPGNHLKRGIYTFDLNGVPEELKSKLKTVIGQATDYKKGLITKDVLIGKKQWDGYWRYGQWNPPVDRVDIVHDLPSSPKGSQPRIVDNALRRVRDFAKKHGLNVDDFVTMKTPDSGLVRWDLRNKIGEMLNAPGKRQHVYTDQFEPGEIRVFNMVNNRYAAPWWDFYNPKTGNHLGTIDTDW